jgi:hypothetical protein
MVSINLAWVDQLIQKIGSDPVGNPPLSIWCYENNGQVVYFVPAHCCDIPSVFTMPVATCRVSLMVALLVEAMDAVSISLINA